MDIYKILKMLIHIDYHHYKNKKHHYKNIYQI